MRLAAIAAAAALSLAVAGEARAVLILGHGTDTCSTWLQVRTTPRAAEYRQWMLGYLSASAFHKNRDILRNMNAEQVFTRVTSDCQRTPTRRIDDVLDGFLR
ncbi:hypothetical protein [Phreatobacter oligotrophus]|jgi:hypothetical protein|uniref:HdeA/HdeB family protein n=1 Tax=Phreatobacter oligotrophus TaxID=1122261 RepID=A0A2T4ZI75_9HYPH|nr:hypothetical protein [Phreatobacter oligotrophus]MBX9992201.1 hypothetical protein [Phreatobacter oligotrophus]PTM61687.1 hypothetical protein C8P69_101358 [Phreatobacter oligotrophus]